ncbi:MAG: MMPL family transporter [Microthrixaceae bacterium]
MQRSAAASRTRSIHRPPRCRTTRDEIGLAVALVLLLLVFRSVFIASLPIVNAPFTWMFAGALVTLLENSFTIPTVGPTLGTMLGLGVGVDYSRCSYHPCIRRARSGHTPEEAMSRALSTAGRAVMCSPASPSAWRRWRW